MLWAHCSDPAPRSAGPQCSLSAGSVPPPHTLSQHQADLCDMLCRAACDAELQQSMVKVNPGPSVSIFLIYSIIDGEDNVNWNEGLAPFLLHTPPMPAIYLLTSFLGFVPYNEGTPEMAACPCALGDPSQPKEDLLPVPWVISAARVLQWSAKGMQSWCSSLPLISQSFLLL